MMRVESINSTRAPACPAVEFITAGCQFSIGTASFTPRRLGDAPRGEPIVPADWSEKLKATVSLASEAACWDQNSSEIALRFVGNACFIQSLYPSAPGTALKRNVARAAAFEPRSIVTASSPNRRTSMRYGCLYIVGVAVGTLVGAAVSPGANGAPVPGARV
jgi:hypothetical protein